MTAKRVYATLGALGIVLPYAQFVPFLQQHGLDFRLFVDQLFANRVSAFFGFDVLVSAAVLFAFVRREGRRLGMRGLWAPVVATRAVGVSLGLPLFLYLREGALTRPSPPPPPD